MTSTEPRFIRTVQAVQVWAHDHPRVVDVLYAIFIGFAALADVIGSEGSFGSRHSDSVATLLVVLGSAMLIWRRLAPMLVLLGVTIVMCTYWVMGYGSYMALIGLSAIYSLVVHAEHRRRALILLAVSIVVLQGVASLTIMNTDDGFSFSNAVSMASYLLATSAAGGVIRNRKQIFVDTQLRAERAEADRLAEAERAVARERIRIAREMHDIVAHGMSVIAVQAAAAQAIVQSDPERTRGILENIETAGRESLTEMRRMLGVLRETDDERGALSPQPTIDDLTSVIANCSAAGIPARLEISGEEKRLSGGVGLAVFRIVQEALTNVLKHAGDEASVVVGLHYFPESLCLVITDTGRGAVSSLSGLGGGNGLIGMRERVDAYEGEFSAGPKVGGGYEVKAVFTLERQST